MSGFESNDPLLNIARQATRRGPVFSIVLMVGVLALLSVVLFVVLGG